MGDGSNTLRVLLLGDARQVHMARWAAYLLDNGCDVLTASLEPLDTVPGPTHALRAAGFLPGVVRYPLVVPAVKRLIDSFRPHLLNAHFLPNYGVIAALSGFAPWVLSTWGSDIMILPDRTPFHRWRTRFVVERATSITSDAEVMSKRLVSFGANPDRILTVPLGVDRSLYRCDPDAGPPGAPRVLSNRKLEPVYDIPAILTAFSLFNVEVPDARLTVAGSGSRGASLRKQAATSDAAGAITFVGEVEHARMPDLLGRHDIYVSMSLSDTTSVSLLEAMACGLFPIVSDLAANREWIEHGHNGWLVPRRDVGALRDAMIEASANRELRAAAAARNTDVIAERADWNDNMARVRTLFDRLIHT